MDETSKRPRIPHGVALVETTDPYSTVPDCVPLLDAGYDVVVCGGPKMDQLCPALDGLPCPLVREADVVINAVRDPSTQAAVVAGVRRCAPDVTIAVIGTSQAGLVEDSERYRDLGHVARHLRRPVGRRCGHDREPVVRVFA